MAPFQKTVGSSMSAPVKTKRAGAALQRSTRAAAHRRFKRHGTVCGRLAPTAACLLPCPAAGEARARQLVQGAPPRNSEVEAHAMTGERDTKLQIAGHSKVLQNDDAASEVFVHGRVDVAGPPDELVLAPGSVVGEATGRPGEEHSDDGVWAAGKTEVDVGENSARLDALAGHLGASCAQFLDREDCAAAAAAALIARIQKRGAGDGSVPRRATVRGKALKGLEADVAAVHCPSEADLRLRRVRFDLEATIIHEISPYSEIYGRHPRSFVFDKYSKPIAAAPGGFVSLQAVCGGGAEDEDEEDSDSDQESESGSTDLDTEKTPILVGKVGKLYDEVDDEAHEDQDGWESYLASWSTEKDHTDELGQEDLTRCARCADLGVRGAGADCTSSDLTTTTEAGLNAEFAVCDSA